MNTTTASYLATPSRVAVGWWVDAITSPSPEMRAFNKGFVQYPEFLKQSQRRDNLQNDVMASSLELASFEQILLERLSGLLREPEPSSYCVELRTHYQPVGLLDEVVRSSGLRVKFWPWNVIMCIFPGRVELIRSHPAKLDVLWRDS